MNYFSLFIGVGAAIGLLRVFQSSSQDKRKINVIVSLIVLVCALIGARCAFILAHFSYFSSTLNETYQFWLGGLSGYGAFAGAVLTCLVISVIRKTNFRVELDQISVLLLPMGIVIWVACAFVGVGYGSILQSGTWWGIHLMDESGVAALRVPVQPAAAFSLFVLLGFTEYFLKTPRQAGLKAGMIGLVFSIHSLLFSLMRVDPVQQLIGLRLDTWASMVFIAGSTILIIVNRRKLKMKNLEEIQLPIEATQ